MLQGGETVQVERQYCRTAKTGIIIFSIFIRRYSVFDAPPVLSGARASAGRCLESLGQGRLEPAKLEKFKENLSKFLAELPASLGEVRRSMLRKFCKVSCSCPG